MLQWIIVLYDGNLGTSYTIPWEIFKGMKKFKPRRKLRLKAEMYRGKYGFSITISTHDRYPWFEHYPDLGDILAEMILELSLARNATVYAWCIMPDHVHILLEDTDIVELVRRFKGKLVPAARKIEPHRKLWNRSFYDHVLRNEESLGDAAMYIWWNPVRKGLVEKPCDYPLSGSLEWPDWKERFFGS